MIVEKLLFNLTQFSADKQTSSRLTVLWAIRHWRTKANARAIPRPGHCIPILLFLDNSTHEQ